MVQLDLQELAIDRRPSEKPTRLPRRTHPLSRLIIPGLIVSGFLVLLVIAGSEQFLSRLEVTVVPVIVSRAEIRQEGTELFQAPGWIEPRPTSISVPALAPGIVERLLVVEGQDVDAQQPVVELIQVDATFTLRPAQAAYDLRKAELNSAQAAHRAAKLRYEQPLHLQAAFSEAQSLLNKTRTAIAQIPFLTKSAEAKVEYARQNLQGKKLAGGGVPQRLVQEAESSLAAAESELNDLLNRPELLEKEAESLQSRAKALQGQLELLIEETRQLDETKAACEGAQARLEEANVALERARLDLKRMTVRAPVAGRVLRLIAYPGTRVMGLEANAGQSSTTVVELYDPTSLQLRADVRLEDVPLVAPGQKVRISTASLKESIEGQVLLPTSTANIQKNTLEVKVAIPNPPLAIRPEMLATATFLTPPPVEINEASKQAERLLIPRELIDTSSGDAVWIVDSQHRAQLRPITLGNAGTGDLVEVSAGLHPTDRLISSGLAELSPGDRVAIVGEDQSLGINRK